jgi:hypothetical protein
MIDHLRLETSPSKVPTPTSKVARNALDAEPIDTSAQDRDARR